VIVGSYRLNKNPTKTFKYQSPNNLNMGKIKSKLVRRTAQTLMQKGIGFTDGFVENKRILGMILPSKKIRNQLAGLLAKTKKYEKIQELKLQKTLALKSA